jgi:heat shock protein HslJ
VYTAPMRRVLIVTSAVLTCAVGAAGPQVAVEVQPSPLVCFGTEPFWNVDLTEPGRARYSRPEGAPAVFRGAERATATRGERHWRGRGRSGDLVVFISEGACSDGMSDTTHPATARVSLPDGTFLKGCCRVPERPASDAGTPLVGTEWRLTSLTGHDPATLSSINRPVVMRFRRDEVSGASGCNGFGGTYTLEPGRVVFGPLMGTMMACPQPAMSIEQAVRKALTGAVSYTLTGDTLTFISGATTLVFTAARRQVASAARQ